MNNQVILAHNDDKDKIYLSVSEKPNNAAIFSKNIWFASYLNLYFQSDYIR